jgi:FKBP-type peptidyl-prolyl cis-trans isomerase SlyD
MTETKFKVSDDMVVGLDYTLRLDDGEIVDGSADGDALEILQGAGQIIPGLEQALYGMGIGDEKQVVVTPAEGYGMKDPRALESVPRSVFPPDLELSPGQRINLREQSGEILTAHVIEVKPDSVRLDFNHPLAGETLNFSVKIASLRPATSAELAEGAAL